MNPSLKQPWIFSPVFDTAFILTPAILITLIVVIFHNSLDALNDVPPAMWLILIVGVDVTHVYSTLFRTYLNRREFKQRKTLYILAPLAAWILGCFLYSISSLTFWRVLAYTAVFHFIRQQFGFMMIYGRMERNTPPVFKSIDKLAIYMATLYPLIYWHCHTRQFSWFVKGDFITIDAPFISFAVGIIYTAIITIYIAKEIFLWSKTHRLNVPKNLLLFGTALSWFVGIVIFNNDLAFTATNVIAHGVPYLALIWIYGYNQTNHDTSIGKASYPHLMQKLFTWKAVPIYLLILFAIAYMEEGLWDAFVWQENRALFHWRTALPSQTTLIWLVPLLALPQATHYILDAFIWRLRVDGTDWKDTLFHNIAR